ncbi:type 2 periplasmic-binding domain-containing protein [Streptomyces lancefieldiae]|uniref:Uncharacterized protein n=1 Tax=Streptomyces lancefieldiae TaxID=3075520 RepID=A0ABU3B330_9ACTN|nr:hypothetical protein [Streptomyces sp. DSM 40712]MDT0616563.1 hypothetical protein [Streptomyces sp. DSM 40712]
MVQLRQAAVADIRQALREDTVDLAVVAPDRQQQRGLATRLLSREEWCSWRRPSRSSPKQRQAASTSPRSPSCL